MPSADEVENFVADINRIHRDFSEYYFDRTGAEKFNLSRTISRVPLEHIYLYRLNLHESINDYLMRLEVDFSYYYRVKTRESIDDKIQRYSNRDDQFPVNGWLNDIFGARIVLSTAQIASINPLLDDWKERLDLKNWYLRDKCGYKGLHIYFKNKNNFFFPWELQIWNKNDVQTNIDNHRKFKRNFI